jgi:hypothetical protein
MINHALPSSGLNPRKGYAQASPIGRFPPGVNSPCAQAMAAADPHRGSL